MGEPDEKEILPDGMLVTAKNGLDAAETIVCGNARVKSANPLAMFRCSADLAVGDARAAGYAEPPSAGSLGEGVQYHPENSAPDLYREENTVAAARLLKQDAENESRAAKAARCRWRANPREAELICERLGEAGLWRSLA
jgi:hypothetical protein